MTKFCKYIRSQIGKNTEKQAYIKCEINFDCNVFYSTQNLTGNLNISTFDKPCIIKQIMFEVSGEAQCKWKSDKYLVMPYIYNKSKIFLERDVLFSEKQNLIKNQMAKVTVCEIPHWLIFKVTLAENLPASWNGKLGNILSQKPTRVAKTHRIDISRVPRVVDIYKGKYQYYCVLRTDKNLVPTNQYFKSCFQITYEVWVSLEGAQQRYKAYEYPNLDTPSIPIIIGTKPLYEWNCVKITEAITNTVYELHRPITSETLPIDKVKQTFETINSVKKEQSIKI